MVSSSFIYVLWLLKAFKDKVKHCGLRVKNVYDVRWNPQLCLHTVIALQNNTSVLENIMKCIGPS